MAYGVYGGFGGGYAPYGGKGVISGGAKSADISSRISEGTKAGYSNFSIDDAGNLIGTKKTATQIDPRGFQTSVIGDPNSTFGKAVSAIAGFLPATTGLIGTIANISNNIRSGKGLLGLGLLDIGTVGEGDGGNINPTSERSFIDQQPIMSEGIERIETPAGARFKIGNQVFATLQDAENFKFSTMPRVQDTIPIVNNQQSFTPNISGYTSLTPGIPPSPEEREAALKLFRESILAQQRNLQPVASTAGVKSLL